MKRASLAAVSALVLALLWAVTAQANGADARPDVGPDPVEPDPGWEIIVSPYLWTTRIDGTVEAHGASADLDVSFSDILKSLNFGAMGAVEVRRGRFFAVLDLFAAALSDDVEAGPVTRTIGPLSFQPPGGGPVLNVPATPVQVGPLELDARLYQVVLDAKLGFRVLDVPWLDLLGGGVGDWSPEPDPRRLVFDLAFGARYWYVRTELDVEMPPIDVPGFTITPSLPAFPGLELPGVSVPGASFGGIDETFEVSTDWVDLTVGGRVAFDLTERILVAVAGDVGGFDIGSSSHRTWMALGIVGYRLSERWTLKAGYKALDTERGPVDMLIHGLVLGASRRF